MAFSHPVNHRNKDVTERFDGISLCAVHLPKVRKKSQCLFPAF